MKKSDCVSMLVCLAVLVLLSNRNINIRCQKSMKISPTLSCPGSSLPSGMVFTYNSASIEKVQTVTLNKGFTVCSFPIWLNLK